MDIKVSENTVFVIDLDDTLYKESDFLKSAFREISMIYTAWNTEEIFLKMMHWYESKEDVFGLLTLEFPVSGIDKGHLLKTYRNHFPSITLSIGAGDLLSSLKEHNIITTLVTDGRTVTQRNKIKALGVESFFSRILISEEIGGEKVTGLPFLLLEQHYPGKEKITIGDNINKDFEWPEKLGWKTIGLKDDGNNIHKQESAEGCHPQQYINSFAELNLVYG